MRYRVMTRHVNIYLSFFLVEKPRARKRQKNIYMELFIWESVCVCVCRQGNREGWSEPRKEIMIIW